VTDIDPKLSRLYRDVSTEGPPPALDAAILAAARQHLAKPNRREHPWWSRWMVPASLMATVVMGVSLTLLITQDHPETLEGDTVRQSSAPPALPSESSVVRSSSADAVQVEQRAKGSVLGVMQERETADSCNAAIGATTSAPSSLKAAPMRSQALSRSPEAWLDDIRRLIREGRAEEAAEQLAEFRKAYPGVSIPEDLGR